MAGRAVMIRVFEGATMRMPCLALPLLAALVAAGPSASAEDLLSPDRPIEEVVDYYLDLRLAAEAIRPAPEADDATLARRLTLDLAGRIPTAGETRAYVE